MWFIFPQIAGLGHSSTAQFYALRDGAESHDYAAHPLLGPRLRDCTAAVLAWNGERNARDIFGEIDAIKFRSSMTLFEAVAPNHGCFGDALAAFFSGLRDSATLERL